MAPDRRRALSVMPLRVVCLFLSFIGVGAFDCVRVLDISKYQFDFTVKNNSGPTLKDVVHKFFWDQKHNSTIFNTPSTSSQDVCRVGVISVSQNETQFETDTFNVRFLLTGTRRIGKTMLKIVANNVKALLYGDNTVTVTSRWWRTPKWFPERSLTFENYYSVPALRDYLPVYYSDLAVSQAMPPNLVFLNDGSTFTETESCRIRRSYRSHRGTQQWKPITGSAKDMFTIAPRSDTGAAPWVLSIDMRKAWFLSPLKLIEMGIIFKKYENMTLGLGGISGFDFSMDYSLIFECGAKENGNIYRMDLTIVPKVLRTEPPGTGLLCDPQSPGLQNLPAYLPSIGDAAQCSAQTNRSYPYLLQGDSYESLHPEEYEWVEKRLVKTAPRVAAFIQAKLGKTLTPDQSKIKIATVLGPGGKRMFLHSCGVANYLYDKGIMDMSTYISGSSGGGLYISSWYDKIIAENNFMSPKDHLDSVKDEVAKTLFDDTVSYKDSFTNAGAFGIPVQKVPYTQPGAQEYNDVSICQSQLKVNAPSQMIDKFASWEFHEIFSRGLAYQMDLNIGGVKNAGLGFTMSSMVNAPVFQNQDVPFLIIPVRNSQTGFAVTDQIAPNPTTWDFTPYDVSIHYTNTHVSYPTALVGTNPLSPDKSCTLNFDQATFLRSFNSYYYYIEAINPPYWGLCGTWTVCRPVRMMNPFWGASTLPSFNPIRAFSYGMLGDAASPSELQSNPMVTPYRDSDILIAPGGMSWTTKPGWYANAPKNPDGTYSCPLDANITCLYGKIPGSDCCNYCWELNQIYNCYPTFSIDTYGPFTANKMNGNNNTYPTVPSKRTKPGKIGSTAVKFSQSSTNGYQRVVFFGCHEVATKTVIIAIPPGNVISGRGSYSTDVGVMKGQVQFGAYVSFKIQGLTPDDLLISMYNSQATLGSTFEKCFACITYAKAIKDNSFMQTDTDCQPCWEEYCWNP